VITTYQWRSQDFATGVREAVRFDPVGLWEFGWRSNTSGFYEIRYIKKLCIFLPLRTYPTHLVCLRHWNIQIEVHIKKKY